MVRQKAFTLIELLVVVAIIVILAAILFPVFARAKKSAKMAASISNLRQVGLATAQYVSDHEGSYPLAQYPYTAGYMWSAAGPYAVPSSWARALTSDPDVLAMHETFVDNTISPYIKNLAVFEEPAGERTDFWGAEGLGGPPQSVTAATSYTYNGYLHGYSESAVAAPAGLIRWWNGTGRQVMTGIGLPAPSVFCYQLDRPCRYVPPSPTCSWDRNGEIGTSLIMGLGGLFTGMDVHQGGILTEFADGHVKWRKLGVYTNGDTDYRVDPGRRYNGGPYALNGWWDPMGCHFYLFRPDFDFDFSQRPS